MNKQINQIVHSAIIVPKRKTKYKKIVLIKMLTKRRASSRTRPAVSTQIKTFPSRRIVSKIVAEKSKNNFIEINSYPYLIIVHL